MEAFASIPPFLHSVGNERVTPINGAPLLTRIQKKIVAWRQMVMEARRNLEGLLMRRKAR